MQYSQVGIYNRLIARYKCECTNRNRQPFVAKFVSNIAAFGHAQMQDAQMQMQTFSENILEVTLPRFIQNQ